ncbi:hypothetical protein, partial [Pseudonocardia sp. ICBG1142]|uniref:hypothetical protein n=1 Tax=Pseudonocardia sp. ICBG1142 TaxID=2846760 RepID=UPI001CF65A3D
MSVARFIADQRTLYRVPHVLSCDLLGVSVPWFYKWAARDGGPEAGPACTPIGTVAGPSST